MFFLQSLRDTDKIVVAGHRGYSARFPENTLLAYREAAEAGCHMVELDVTLSKDGVPVISHDDRLERVSDGHGMIAEHSLAELKSFDLGGRHGLEFKGLQMPSFQEAMELLKGYPGLLVDVDFKIGPAIEETLEAALKIIEALDMKDRCIFNSCDGKIVEKLYEKGCLTVGAPKSFKEKVHYTEQTYDQLWAVCIPMDELSPESAREYLDRGLVVAATSPDTFAQLRYALRCGATFMIVDEVRPAVKLAKLLNK